MYYRRKKSSYTQRNKELQSIADIIPDFARKSGIEAKMKQLTLFNYWPEVVGRKFIYNTKAAMLMKRNNYDVLCVAVASPVISQELAFFKRDLLKKLSTISDSLGFNIKDIVFSAKLWKEIKKTTFVQEKKNSEIKTLQPTEEELDKINIPENSLNNIISSLKADNFKSEEDKNKFLKSIIKDLKKQIWWKEKGYPCCDKCGVPVYTYNEEKRVLCPSCKYSY